MGLLNPRHPSVALKTTEDGEAPTPAAGAAAFAKFGGSGEMAASAGEADAPAAMDYPDAPPPVQHHNWLNWRPSDVAARDDELVQGVLGSSADLSGAALPNPPPSNAPQAP